MTISIQLPSMKLPWHVKLLILYSLLTMDQDKKLLIAIMMAKMMIVQLGSYSAGMYILGVTKNMWLSSILWAIGAFIVWHIFEKYMERIRRPAEWMQPISRTGARR